MFLTWKVGTTSLSTTSRSSWWIQKHLTARLYRTGSENSRNSCPTSAGFGRLFSIHTTSVPDVTAQLRVWEKCGRAVAQGKPKAGAADTLCTPTPLLLEGNITPNFWGIPNPLGSSGRPSCTTKPSLSAVSLCKQDYFATEILQRTKKLRL